MTAEYSLFIGKAVARGYTGTLQWTYDTDTGVPRYYLKFWDANECYDLYITDASDIANFEANYKDLANRKINNVESLTGWYKVRHRKMAGDVRVVFTYFTTSVATSLDCGSCTNFSMTVNDEKTKTIIDFCPAFDYEVAGGAVYLLTTPGQRIFKMDFIAAPDIPEEYGGNFRFVHNKKFSGDLIKFYLADVDAKLFRYIPEMPVASKLRLEITHAAGDQSDFEYFLMTSVNI